MSDHHVDSMDIDYPEAAKHVLQSHGIYISGAPPINHKPGNDFISDVYWPFPTYPDYRFRNTDNLDIQQKPVEPDPPVTRVDSDEGKDFQIIPEELEKLKYMKNPMITFTGTDRNTFFDKADYPYTGTVLQALEKKAFDISYVKPYYENHERKTKLIRKEIITGHFMSIATYDGWKYHIYRGLCVDILKTNPVYSKNNRRLYTRSVPFGNPVVERDLKRNDIEEMISKNVHIILDVSEPQRSEIAKIPVGQIIDIQHYNYIYNFTIYEGEFKLFWEDWVTTHCKHNSVKFHTYVPFGDKNPQNLYHEVIEHQKPYTDHNKRG